MISTDRKIFERNSTVKQRVVEYGRLVDELKIIVFNSLEKGLGERKSVERISGSSVTLYPTNSKNKFFYIYDAIKIGRKIIKDDIKHRSQKSKNNWLVTTQDAFATGLVGWFVSKTYGTKLQLQIHTDFTNIHFQGESLFNLLKMNIAWFLIPRADGIRVVSERIKQSLKAKNFKLKAEPQVLPIFVNIKKFEDEEASFDLHKKYPQFEFIILTVARLETEKNLSLALKIISDVTVKNPKIGLVVVGEGSLSNYLKEEAQTLGIQNNVIFEGWQDNLVSHYKTADLFMFTSNYEGYGLALIEAAASGCPIITSDVGVAGNLLNRESLRICKVGDRKCFVEGILDLKKNGLALYDMSIKARKRIEENVIRDKQEYLNQMKRGWEEALNS